MEQVSIRNPGVSALEIEIGNSRILVDAFNSVNKPETVRAGDIILFTHDDADHFEPAKLPDLSDQYITIVGPPSIVKPILDAKKADLCQIMPIYTHNNAEPRTVVLSDICITSFSTPHFINWGSVHNSYMISHSMGNIYITGDSYLTKDYKSIIGSVDIAVCNLIDEGYITRRDDPRFAIHHHLSYLLDIISTYKPRRVIGTHLIGFDGAVDAKAMKKLVNSYGFDEILIPADSSEIIEL